MLSLLVSYLFYGPFTSFAPLYDSSRSNMSKEDSDLLLSTYTDATGLQFAHRLVYVVDIDVIEYAERTSSHTRTQ